MDREWALARLKAIKESGSTEEEDHYDADRILCDLLDSLGFEDVVKAWERINKWYS